MAPILYKNCTNCHRPGEIAPMSLLTYKETRPWAKSIGNQVSRGVMPPWHADPSHGEFLNDRRLSTAEKDTILKWVSAGAPEGDPNAAPTPPVYESGWTIGRPDAIFSMQEDYPVPADGTVAYKYFEISTHLTEDKWVQSIEVKAGNPAVVRASRDRVRAHAGAGATRAHGRCRSVRASRPSSVAAVHVP